MFPPTLAVESRPGRGRCLVATTAIPANTLLFLSAPATFFPSSNSTCGSCLSPKAPSRCKTCKAVSYCDSTCQKRGWADHKHECAMLKAFLARPTECDPSIWLPMLSLARLYRGLSLAGGCAAPTTATTPALHIPTLEDFRALQNPAAGAEGVDGSKAPSSTQGLAATVVALGRTLELFPPSISDATLAGDFHRMHLNNFMPTDAMLVPVGVGSYPAAALMNHSCRPNVCLSYGLSGTTVWPEEGGATASVSSVAPVDLRPCMAVRTLTPLAPGEEVCHAYLDISLPLHDRASDLANRYGFKCDCPACKEEREAVGSGGSSSSSSRGSGSAVKAEDVEVVLKRGRLMVLRSRVFATEPELPGTLEVLKAMEEEKADPPGIPVKDWQDSASVVQLETAILLHGYRILSPHLPQDDTVMVGCIERLLELANLVNDWALAEAALCHTLDTLASRSTLRPYCAPGSGGPCAAYPKHPRYAVQLPSLLTVYKEWGVLLRARAGGDDMAPIPPPVLARRTSLGAALGLCGEGSHFAQFLGLEGGGFHAIGLLAASQRVAGRLVDVHKACWGSNTAGLQEMARYAEGKM